MTDLWVLAGFLGGAVAVLGLCWVWLRAAPSKSPQEIMTEELEKARLQRAKG